MAEYVNAPPTAPGGGQGRNHQATPSQGPKRNNRNRKNNQHNQGDGAMSDGALMNPTVSPRPRKTKQRSTVASVPRAQQRDNMGQGNAQKARPVSYAGGRVPATPAKEQAYAGPTFQASPAASALPMPKFSKSVPSAGMRGSLSARLAEERTSEGEQSSPEADVAALTPPPREDVHSPLDLFFKADREEKARSASQTLSPQTVHRAQHPVTEPHNGAGHSGWSIFLNELDGDADTLSPQSAPRNDHRPHLGHKAMSSPGVPQRHVDSSEEERRANTRNLKTMLFSGGPSDALKSQMRTPAGTGASHGNNSFHSPSPFNRPSSGPDARLNSGPSTPQPTHEQHQDNYSLHYGNRNLSPLFKASQSESRPRPSLLRQEMASHPSSTTGSGAANGELHSPHTHSRNHLHQTAPTAGPVGMMMHQAPDRNHVPAFHGSSMAPPPQSTNAEHGGPGQAGNPHASAARGNELRDMSAESAELRRMLKIF